MKRYVWFLLGCALGLLRNGDSFRFFTSSCLLNSADSHRLHPPQRSYLSENDEINHQSSLDALKTSISTLRKEREKTQLDMIAIDVAILEAQKELVRRQSNISSSFTSFDYGYSSKSWGSSIKTARGIRDSSVPPSALFLATDNFRREFLYLLQGAISIFSNENKEVKSKSKVQGKIKSLKLSNEKIWRREDADPNPVKTSLLIKAPYLVLCLLLDRLFEGEPISRFYFLETVARMPYFSYITMLHTYETLGWWRRSTEAKRVHFAEEYNEYHHLLIWESLGGDQAWRVRFLAQHSAIVYFFVLIVLWTLSPTLAYNFSELIEKHAVHTYTEFAESNKETLQSLSAPSIAKDYYEAPDLYVFDEFQTQLTKGSRRVVIGNLYDVVCAIRDDEAEHVKTMRQCQDPEVLLRSPNTEAALGAVAVASAAIAAYLSIQQPELAGIDSSTFTEIATGAAAQLGESASKLFNDASFMGREVLLEGGGASSEGLEEGVGMAGEAIEGDFLKLIFFKMLSLLRL